MSSLTYRPELDGLRCVAVYLVVAFHAQMALLDGGFVGVDLFFVLSGFLVTGVLLRDVDVHGRFRLSEFYARRVRRLLPAAVLVILVTAALQVVVASLPDRVGMVGEARASLLYYANWHFILEGRDYFADDTTSSPFLHFWSLSIEEQFYIVYPIVLVLVWRFARRPVRTLAMVLSGVVLVSVALQVWIARDDISLAYYGTHTRVYQLAAGALLMLVVRRARHGAGRRRASSRIPGPRGRGTLMSAVGLVGIVVMASSAVDLSQSTRGIATTLCAVLAIAGLWDSPGGLPARMLALPLPRYLGQISYGTYLWHWPTVLVLDRVLDVRPLVLTIFAAALSTGLAALSFQVFETPIRRAKVPSRLSWATVGGGLAVSVVAFALVVGPVLNAAGRPALVGGNEGSDVGSAVAALDRPVPPDLDLVAAREDVGPEERACTAGDPEGCLFTRGSGQHILVLGDSEAQTLGDVFLEIAEARDLQLSMMFTPGCPWQVDQVIEVGRDSNRALCRERREVFYRDVLPTLDVDVVVVAGLSRSQPYWQSRVSSPTGPADETLAEMQQRTTEKTADLVRSAGKDLVIVNSIIGTNGHVWIGFDPIDCLAGARRLVDCAVERPIDRPSVDSTYDVLAVTRDDVATLDVNPLICPGGAICSPVVKGVVVWSDDHHVTATFFTRRADRIWQLLTDTGLVDDVGA